MPDKEKRVPRWYFGGLASAGAACFTHPLDLIKVHLQTQQKKQLGFVAITARIVKTEGVLALYNGLSASLLRQLTYSMTRFAIYEAIKRRVKSDAFYTKVGIAAMAGCIGGFVGTPADLVNVRMQNDIKLPIDQRRNYKHALDGLYKVTKDEGIRRLFSGASTASTRAVLMTVGQLSFYDQIKAALLKLEYFRDNITTHFFTGFLAGISATILTQPVDVIKTRMMNSKPGEFRGMGHVILYTAQNGPLGFFKGLFPSALRIIPMNILVFIFYEQLRQNFGYIPRDKST